MKQRFSEEQMHPDPPEVETHCSNLVVCRSDGSPSRPSTTGAVREPGAEPASTPTAEAARV